MKKASKILLLIGGILGILLAVYALCSGIFAALFAGFSGTGMFGIGVFSLLLDLEVLPLEFRIFGDTASDIIYIVYGGFMVALAIIVLVVMLVSAIMQLVAAILALKARGKNEKKGLYIANFVFGGLLLFIFSAGWMTWIVEILIIVGSVLGLIAMKKAAQEQAEEQQEDASEVVEEIK